MPEDELNSVVYGRLTWNERNRLKEEADRAGEDMSQCVRRVILGYLEAEDMRRARVKRTLSPR